MGIFDSEASGNLTPFQVKRMPKTTKSREELANLSQLTGHDASMEGGSGYAKVMIKRDIVKT